MTLNYSTIKYFWYHSKATWWYASGICSQKYFNEVIARSHVWISSMKINGFPFNKLFCNLSFHDPNFWQIYENVRKSQNILINLNILIKSGTKNVCCRRSAESSPLPFAFCLNSTQITRIKQMTTDFFCITKFLKGFSKLHEEFVSPLRGLWLRIRCLTVSCASLHTVF